VALAPECVEPRLQELPFDGPADPAGRAPGRTVGAMVSAFGPGRARTLVAIAPVSLALLAVALVGSACGTTTAAPTTSTTSTTTSSVGAPSCPTGEGDGLGLASPEQPERPGLDAALVPPGAVVATVCRYGGVSSTAGGGPVRSAAVMGASLDALVEELDSAKWQVVAQPAVYSCPMWDGGRDVVEVAYPSGPRVRVTVDIGGCGFASNGVRTVEGYDLVPYLARWVGAPTVLPA
jgi:hypothetical protein